MCGFFNHYPVLNRSTPYHFPHSTLPAGTVPVYGGDDRWMQNVFVGGKEEGKFYGTSEYNGSPTSMEEYIERVKALGYGDLEQFERVKQPVFIRGNVYLNGALPFEAETNCCVCEARAEVQIVRGSDGVYLEIELPKEMFLGKGELVTSEKLGMTRITEERFEEPDGSDLRLDTDLAGNAVGDAVLAGPLQGLHAGTNRVKIWETPYEKRSA